MNIVLIPAYKPDDRLPGMARTLRDEGLTVVIVDDGSGAAYRPLFEEARQFALVITCEENRGKGAALKTGLARIREEFAPPFTVTTADADGQHRPEDILRVSRRAQSCPDALVLGCRSIDRSMPLRNWFGNFYTKIAFFLATGCYVHDTQTGLRGFSDRLLPFLLSVRGSRYEYEMNVLLFRARYNGSIEEVPICTVYPDGNSTSHFKAVRDSVIIYGEILRFSAFAFTCFAFGLLLFCLAMLLTPHPALANLGARLGSATLFAALTGRSLPRCPCEKRLSLTRFALFECAVTVLGTALLFALTALGLPPLAAKVIADVTLFFGTLPFFRRVIFVDKRR